MSDTDTRSAIDIAPNSYTRAVASALPIPSGICNATLPNRISTGGTPYSIALGSARASLMRAAPPGDCAPPSRSTLSRSIEYATSYSRSAMSAPACTRGVGKLFMRSIEQRNLRARCGRHFVAAAAARFVRLEAAHLDGRSFGRRGLAIDQALVARRRVAAPHADRATLVDH